MEYRSHGLQNLLDALDEGVCLLDLEGRVTAANVAALRLLKRLPDELPGQAAGETFAPATLAGALQSLAAHPTEPMEGEAVFRRSDGVAVAVNFGLVAMEEDGVPIGALLRFREPPEPPSCEALERDNEIKLDVILDTMVDAVIAADEKGRIQLYNQAAERMFGYRAEEVMGRNVKMLMPSPDHEAHDGYLRNYLETGVRKIIGIGREVNAKRKDGSLVPIYLSIGDARMGERRLFVAVLHDLTRLNQTQERLKLLTGAVEQSPAAVMIASISGVLEYVNPGFTRLTGYAADEALGKPLSLLQTSRSSQARLQQQLDVLRHNGGRQEELECRNKRGDCYWALQTLSPLRDKDGQVTHILATQQDITEQKRAKQALLESEERFQQVAQMTGEWLWEQDPEGRYTYSSNAVFGILGYRPDELIGKHYCELMTPEDQAMWAELITDNAAHKSFRRLINRYRHRDGHEVYTESTGSPLFDRDGRVIKWRGVDSDVTARKHYEDALKLRDRAIEAASVGIDITDARLPDNPNIYVNAALSRLTGYTKDELLGRSMSILQGPDTDPGSVKDITAAIQDGRGCEVILKNYRKDGTPFWNDLVISPVHDDAGKVTHYIGVQSDVTELRRAAEERHELEIAKQIQLSLLPKAPLRIDGVRVAGACLPAAHVGGDYYDYFLSGDALDVVIADVSGHSVGAALIMAEARSALQAEMRLTCAGRLGHGVAGILHTLNEVLHDDLSGADLFISMFYLRYFPDQRLLHYGNAGHNCPLLLSSRAEQCQPLDAEGMILGVKRQIPFAEESLQLELGDRVLLYTDGATDAQNPSGDFYGIGRLCELLQTTRHQPPEQTITTILADLQQFCNGQPFNDDISIVVMDVAETHGTH
ncbi:MAG: PAS domain S-box protein [Methylococcaceae bacterium]|nr:PAS domain S-box protein [Methylococcaceae bacterium]